MDIRKNLVQCRKEIEDLKERLARLRSGMTSGVAQLTGMPKGGSNGDHMAECTVSAILLEEQWENAKMHLTTYMYQLEVQLKSCKDPLVRLAVRLKYESGLTWQQVAQQTGSTKDSLRMLVKRYFETL